MSLQFESLAFAFTAGVFSIFSPCSYALLPGYVSYYLGERFTLGQAFTGGIASTLGLVTVFTFIGAIASSFGELIPQIIPKFELVAGAFLIAMGVVTITRIQVPLISLPLRPSQRRGIFGLYTFGVIYGLTGIGCSAPIFLSILFYSMSKGLAEGFLTFVLYALGMGAPLILTTILLAQAREYVVNRIKRVAPWLQKFSGLVLIVVGFYLFYFYYTTYM